MVQAQVQAKVQTKLQAQVQANVKRLLKGALLVQTLGWAGMAFAQNCEVDKPSYLSAGVEQLQTTIGFGGTRDSPQPLNSRQVRNLLLLLRRTDNTFVGKVGIVNGQASQMRLAILGTEVITDRDVREALTCLTRGWKEGCGFLCENEYQPIPVEVLAGEGFERWLELARPQTWGFLGANTSRANIFLPGGKSPSGLLLIQSPVAGDVVLIGSLFGSPNPSDPTLRTAGGIKAPALATLLKQILQWEAVKNQSRPYLP